MQAAVAASGGYLQIPDLYINMANVALAKQVRPGPKRGGQTSRCHKGQREGAKLACATWAKERGPN